MLKNPLAVLILLRGINALPILFLLASLNQLLNSNGFLPTLAADLTGTILAISYCLSIISGYLATNFICIHKLYRFSSYFKGAILLSLISFHSREMILLVLAGFIAGLDIQKIAVTSIMNDVSKGNNYLRRKIMIMSYAAINLAAIIAYGATFIFFHFHKTQYIPKAFEN